MKMIIPTIEEVTLYMTSIGGSVELGEKLWFHYSTIGWKVGKNPMKNWQSSCQYWKRTEKKQDNGNRFNNDSVTDRLSKW